MPNDLFVDVIGGSPSATLTNATGVGASPAANALETWNVTFVGTWPTISATAGQIRCLIDNEVVILTAVDGQTTGLTSGSFRVGLNKNITLTYTIAPTWKWYWD